MRYVNLGATVHQMVRNDDLRGGVMEERIDGEEDYDQRETMRGAAPLEEVFSSKKGGSGDDSLIESGDWTIVGLVEKLSTSSIVLQTPKDSVGPQEMLNVWDVDKGNRRGGMGVGEMDPRVSWKRRGIEGGCGVHTEGRYLTCQQLVRGVRCKGELGLLLGLLGRVG